MRPTVAYVVKGYPRLSETFIAQEIRALEKRGFDLAIYSLRRPTDSAVHAIHGDIVAPVTYLPEYLYRQPIRLWRAWRGARRLSGYGEARAAWLRDLRRDPSVHRIRRFGQALVLAHEITAGIAHFHAHFLHSPASVTRYASLMTGLPWSGSAHAKDIWTTPGWEKSEKLAACSWLATCTALNRDVLAEMAPHGRVVLAYHGLDLADLPPPPARPPRDGSDPRDPLTFLCVGRAVEKKGLETVLAALARLPEDVKWRFLHVGGGPLLAGLKRSARKAGIDHRITWLGPRSHDEVYRRYRDADLFVLACRVAADGDRDGLPNVLMEAQSQGLPVVATRVSAIPELIEDGVTGVLVAPDQPQALADALADLAADPRRRAALGAAARARLEKEFTIVPGIDILAAKLSPYL